MRQCWLTLHKVYVTVTCHGKSNITCFDITKRVLLLKMMSSKGNIAEYHHACDRLSTNEKPSTVYTFFYFPTNKDKTFNLILLCCSLQHFIKKYEINKIKDQRLKFYIFATFFVRLTVNMCRQVWKECLYVQFKKAKKK